MKFLCTFCWVPHFPPAQPRILGESGRITCERCYNAILDLSICWVCGEIIVRGEDVLSLGWCFWHKTCFGCLLCLQPLSVDGCVYDRISRQNGALELTAPPLCPDCDEVNQDQSLIAVTSKALKSVSRRDVGLSLSRYHRWEERRNSRQATEGLTSRGRRQDIDDSIEERCRSFTWSHVFRPSLPAIQDRHSLDENPLLIEDNKTPTTYLGEDGNADMASPRFRLDEADNGCEPSLGTFNGSQSIYVSILNPTIEPAFKSSPTKPIPKWMDFLPGNRERKLQRVSTEAQAGSPVSAKFCEPDEHDISDDHSDPRHGVRSPSDSTPYPSSGATTPVANLVLSPVSRHQQRDGSFEKADQDISAHTSSLQEGLEMVNKLLEESRESPNTPAKDVKNDLEPSDYFTIPLWKKIDEDSSVDQRNDTRYLDNDAPSKRSESARRKARYVPPDESGWQGKLRDRFRRGTIQMGTNRNILTAMGTGAYAPEIEPPSPGERATSVVEPDDRMAEARKELMGLFGEAN